MKRIRSLKAGLSHPFQQLERLIVVLGISSFFFLLMTIASNPPLFLDLVGANILYFDEAIVNMTSYNFAVIGLQGMVLTVVYTFLIAILLVNLKASFVSSNQGVLGAPFAAIGIFASGCAGCGVGLLGFVGITGVLATTPVQGDIIRIIGIAITLVVISRIGNPEVCELKT